ncbi:MAG: phosphotransferase [Pseudomonadales bacterium]
MPNDRLAAALESWPKWSASPPTMVRELKGGLTNQSYLIQVGDTRLVLRLSAENANELGLDRALEIQVLQRASPSRVAPALVYGDPEGRVLITEYHAGACWQAMHSHEADKLQQLAQLLKTVHRLAPVDRVLDLHRRAEHYWLAINESNTPLVRTLRTLAPQLQDFFQRAAAACTQLRLCHNDLLAENLLIRNDAQLLALDWEYAAMGDPYFDLAVVIEGQQFDDASAQTLLEYYADVPIIAALQRLAPLRIIYCYLDLLWNLVQGVAPNQAMIESKFERLRNIVSA